MGLGAKLARAQRETHQARLDSDDGARAALLDELAAGPPRTDFTVEEARRFDDLDRTKWGGVTLRPEVRAAIDAVLAEAGADDGWRPDDPEWEDAPEPEPVSAEAPTPDEATQKEATMPEPFAPPEPQSWLQARYVAAVETAHAIANADTPASAILNQVVQTGAVDGGPDGLAIEAAGQLVNAQATACAAIIAAGSGSTRARQTEAAPPPSQGSASAPKPPEQGSASPAPEQGPGPTRPLPDNYDASQGIWARCDCGNDCWKRYKPGGERVCQCDPETVLGANGYACGCVPPNGDFVTAKNRQGYWRWVERGLFDEHGDQAPAQQGNRGGGQRQGGGSAPRRKPQPRS